MTGSQIKYIATVAGAREVGLHGIADPAHWAGRLQREGLAPTELDGGVPVVLTGVDGRWGPVRFRDVSVSVGARPIHSDDASPGFYLVRAFNSSRFFASVERHWFGTPYVHRADTSVEVSPSPTVTIGPVTAPVLEALACPDVPMEDAGEAHWEGPLFLPSRKPRRRSMRFFFVRIRGATLARAFDRDRDTYRLDEGDPDPLVQALGGCGFTAVRWAVRHAATHSRSKTLRDTTGAG